MNFKTINRILSERYPSKKTDLNDIKMSLAKLGSPQEKFKTIHVAGTNGKGSVCAMFAEIFKTSGYKTGFYVSPHLIDIRERIQINGKLISKKDFANAVGKVLKIEPRPFNFFELITCAAFYYFAQKKVDIAIVEVGLGGKFDATNVLKNPLLTIITSISFDHTNLLGEDIKKIAYEKACIMKKNVSCICGPLPREAKAVVDNYAASIKTTAYHISPKEMCKVIKINWLKNKTKLKLKKEIFTLSMLGKVQAVNVSLVIKSLELLRESKILIETRNIKTAFKNIKWPGRFEVKQNKKLGGFHSCIILDGGHNGEAAKSFSETFLISPFKNKPFVFVIGILKDKDYKAIIKQLKPHLNKVIVTSPSLQRGLSPFILADYIASEVPHADIEVHSDLQAAMLSAKKHKFVVVIGSFYLVGSADELLK